jgi:DNA modification methylase
MGKKKQERNMESRCECANPKEVKANDVYNTVYCGHCIEVIRYEVPQKGKPTLYVPTDDDLEKIKKLELNRVYNTDVFKLIQELPNQYLDLIITDPPYGDGTGYGRNNKEILNNEDFKINVHFLEAIYDKLKDNSTVYLFSNHKFYEEIKRDAVKMGYNYRMLLIIVKSNMGMGNPFRNQYEVCLVLEKGKPEYYTKSFSNVIKMKKVTHGDDDHPHTKQEYMLRHMIKHSSKKGDLVFDGFMGSFATAKACIKEGRNYLGSELNKDWFIKGIKELKDVGSTKEMKFEEDGDTNVDTAQGSLF